MDYLRQQLEAIRGQLGSLSASGKIASGLLALLVVIGIYWLATLGAGSGWTMLLDQPVASDDATAMQAEMLIAGIESKVEGDRIYVKGGAGNRQRAQALLAQRGVMPTDTAVGFSTLIEASNPFVPEKEMDRRWMVGLQNEIATVLREFRGIRDASVLIQVPRKRGVLNRDKGVASASVNLKTDFNKPLESDQVEAIASFVSGAVEGLLAANVSITDGRNHYRTEKGDDQARKSLLAEQQAQEEHYRNMIYDRFRYIPGMVATVRVKLRDETERVESKELGGQPFPVSETSESTESKNASVAAGPGVRPNQGTAVTGGSDGRSSTTEKSETTFSSERDVTIKETLRPPGFLDMLTASVSVPHSYLAHIYRQQNNLEQDNVVNHEQILAVSGAVLADIEKQIETLLYNENLAQAEVKQVAVDWFYDDIPTSTAALSGDAALAATGGGMTDYIGMLREYGPTIGLLFLAVVPLFYVMRLAKKAQTMVAAGGDVKGNAGVDEDDDLEVLGGGPIAVGQAEGMHSTMVGHEVDEGLVRTQQIVDQIAELVKEDPGSAATIIEGWLAEPIR